MWNTFTLFISLNYDCLVKARGAGQYIMVQYFDPHPIPASNSTWMDYCQKHNFLCYFDDI